MEDLTKTQLILLALLVSFVTSMATGIVTVALMEEAPEPVVQTINRIVERTVETVREAVPVVERGSRQNVVTKETTVVVKDEDLITSTIEKNSATFVRISARPGTREEENFVGLGVVIGESGIVATDAALVPSSSGTLRASLANGESYALSPLETKDDRGVALLKMSRPTTSENTVAGDKTFTAVTFSDMSALKLGQTVIALGGRARTSVAMGIISALVLESDDAAEEADGGAPALHSTPPGPRVPVLSAIETTLVGSTILPGTPLFNIFGEFVALAVSTTDPSAREYIAGGELARLAATLSTLSLDTQ